MSCALHLSRLVEDHNQRGKEPELEPLILVIEKGREIGSHALSGAVVDPRGFDELIKALRGQYGKVIVRKPKASRPRSREVYVLAVGRKL